MARFDVIATYEDEVTHTPVHYYADAAGQASLQYAAGARRVELFDSVRMSRKAMRRDGTVIG